MKQQNLALPPKEEKRALPPGWRWVRLGEVCSNILETRDPRKMPEKSFLYVDISSIDNKFKRIVNPAEILGSEAPSRARQVIQKGDVLVATTRPNLNAVALVPPELDNEICSTGFCVLRSDREAAPELLFAFVQSPGFINEVSELVKGALYPAVTDKQVRDITLPLPPLPEQKRIAGILTEQMAAVERARVAAQTQLEAAKALPAAYLRAVLNSPEAKKWRWVRLGEAISEAQPGFACGLRDSKGVVQLRMNNVDTRGNLVWNDFIRVPADDKTVLRFKLEKGDVVFNNTNSTELVGKSALFRGFSEPVVYSNHFTRLRPNPEKLDEEYLASWLLFQWLSRVFENLCNRWIGQSAVKNDKLFLLRFLSLHYPNRGASPPS